MMVIAATPFSAMLMVFGAVPLGVLIAIYGGEGAVILRRRHQQSGQVGSAIRPLH